MTREPAVFTENLTRKFGSFTAVDHVSLEVDYGEIFGFLGANGAGKTTTIRMMCGLLMPSGGQGRIAGHDIATEPEKIKRSIGYMSQKFSLYPDLTGLENLNFYGSAYSLDHHEVRTRIDELSQRLELTGFLSELTGQLPAGWRQRLALAASMLHRPKILFLDEPTSGVDPVFRRRFWDILYQLADEGVAIFVTTHYMDEAEFCGTVSIMHAGKIIEQGKPRELVARFGAADLEELFVSLIRQRESQVA